MPHECMRLRVLRTASALSTRSPVIGQIPPLANVAAMTLPDSHVTSIEHSWKGNKEHLSDLIWAIIASNTVKDNYVSEWQLIYLKVEVKGCHHVNSTGKTLQEKMQNSRWGYKSCQYAYENDSEQRETYFFLFEIIANRIVPVTGLFLWLEALNITRTFYHRYILDNKL